MARLFIAKCLIGLFILIGSCSAINEYIRLNKEGQFIDSKGRTVLLHGFNNVQKSIPYYDAESLNITRIKLFQQWGFKVVRLGVIWYAAHLGPQKFNETYIATIKNIVSVMSDHGIYSLLDMHQDAMSERYGTYNAIPDWVLDLIPKPSSWLAWPWPFRHISDIDWFENYLTYACQKAFQGLYSDTNNALIHWGDFWEKIANTFKNDPSIIGYELINEPFAGDIFTNPMRLLPGYAGRKNLLPVYDYLISRIRKVDSDTLIFYEPVTWGVFKSSVSWLGTGFNRAPGTEIDPSEAQKTVLSYHYYCWVLQTADPKSFFPKWKRVVCDEVLMKRVFDSSAFAVATTGGGRFLTEFGLCAPDGKAKTINTLECSRLMEMADDEFQSWTYWDSHFFNSDGSPRLTPLKYFSRVYPVATCGVPKKLKFDPKKSEFSYTFDAVKPENGKKEADRHPNPSDIEAGFPLVDIFVPVELHYTNGFDVSLSPSSLSWTWIKNEVNMIRIESKEKSIKSGTRVSISIKPNESVEIL